MLGQREAVGHPGDEVRDVPGIKCCAARRRRFTPFGRKRLGLGAVALEEILHHIFGLAHDAHDTFVPVDVGGEKGADLAVLVSQHADALVRAGRSLGRPGALRVTVGTSGENERFLAALGELV